MRGIPPQTIVAILPLALVMAAGWVGLASRRVRQVLAERVARRPAEMVLPALLLLLGAALYQVLTGRLDLGMLGRAGAYWIAPLLLLGGRRREVQAITWRDYAALLAFFLPVHLHWLGPRKDLLASAIPAASVPLALYYLVVVRGLPEPGYTFRWTWTDVKVGVRAFLLLGLVAVPVATALGFAAFTGKWSRLERLPLTFLIVLLAIAIPEELLFRGFLQSMLERTLRSRAAALVLAAALFGASHWNHFQPRPNWHYVLLATLAGLAYGHAYRVERRLPPAALAHTLIDTTWFLFFMGGRA